MRRMIKRVLGAVLLLVGVLLLTGVLLQDAGEKRDAETYVATGKRYEVNGKQMHIYTGGQETEKGAATVILASGWGTPNPYADFYPLYEQLGQQTKFAVYDRFGSGFSELTDAPRDIDTIVSEIHTLLEKSGQKPPYVWAAHSLGSLEAIRFAQLYPDEVKGIVLIDGGSPEYYAQQKPITAIAYVQRMMVNFGIARALLQSDDITASLNDERNGLKLLPEALRELDKKATLLLGANKNVREEMSKSQVNAQHVAAEGKPLHLPLIVLTAGKDADPKWLESQQALVSWSDAAGTKQIIAENARHYIHQYNPKLVADAILELASK